jgi:hypothetical protein
MKSNLNKSFKTEKEDDGPLDTDKVKSQEFKLMQLSEEAREALKKVQRFDRILYAQ